MIRGLENKIEAVESNVKIEEENDGIFDAIGAVWREIKEIKSNVITEIEKEECGDRPQQMHNVQEAVDQLKEIYDELQVIKRATIKLKR